MKTYCGSTSKSKQYIFCFLRTINFWSKHFKGFNHCALLIPKHGGQAHQYGDFMLFEPMLSNAHIHYLSYDDLISYSNYTKLLVTVKNKPKNRLTKLGFQSCSTLIQYAAGISLGAYTPQGLYECLTEYPKDWLEDKGVIEVSKWEK